VIVAYRCAIAADAEGRPRRDVYQDTTAEVTSRPSPSASFGKWSALFRGALPNAWTMRPRPKIFLRRTAPGPRHLAYRRRLRQLTALALLAAAGWSTRDIAPVAGVDHSTVVRDSGVVDTTPATVTVARDLSPVPNDTPSALVKPLAPAPKVPTLGTVPTAFRRGPQRNVADTLDFATTSPHREQHHETPRTQRESKRDYGND
jgi:hypothetical protein